MIRTMIAAMLLAGSMAATASEDSGIEFGFGLGNAKVEDTIFGVSIDEKAFSWKVFGGYQFSRYLTAELAYHDGMDRSWTVDDETLKLETDSLQASVIGTLPLGEYLSVFARAGMTKWEAKASLRSPFGDASIDDDGTDPSYGVGIGVNFDGALLRFEYERGKFEDTTAKLLSLSVAWKLP